MIFSENEHTQKNGHQFYPESTPELKPTSTYFSGTSEIYIFLVF